MDNNEKELYYWISKTLLTDLLENRLISEAEYHQLCRKLKKKYKPMIGGLDGEIKQKSHQDKSGRRKAR